jgi:hypothetical protein
MFKVHFQQRLSFGVQGRPEGKCSTFIIDVLLPFPPYHGLSVKINNKTIIKIESQTEIIWEDSNERFVVNFYSSYEDSVVDQIGKRLLEDGWDDLGYYGGLRKDVKPDNEVVELLKIIATRLGAQTGD